MATAVQPRPNMIPEIGISFPETDLFGPQSVTHGYEMVGAAGRPDRMLLGTLGHRGFRVVTAIPVSLCLDGDMVVAVWQEIDEFGSGAHASSACEDLGHTLVELYQSLEADQSRLGPDLKRVWGLLQEYVTRQR